MADQVLTDRTELTTSASGDFLHIVDVSDTTDGAQGTSKKIQKNNIIPTSNKGIVETSSVFGLGDGETITFVWDALASASNTNGANFTFNDLQIILEKLSTTSGNGAKIQLQETLLRLEQGNHYIDIDKTGGIVFNISGTPPTARDILRVTSINGNEAILGYTTISMYSGEKLFLAINDDEFSYVFQDVSNTLGFGVREQVYASFSDHHFIDGDAEVYSDTYCRTSVTQGYTVATLPTGVIGMRAYVTDATTPTYLGTLTGGGAVTCPVFFDGTNWIS